jgi:hypothetical protein
MRTFTAFYPIGTRINTKCQNEIDQFEALSEWDIT